MSTREGAAILHMAVGTRTALYDAATATDTAVPPALHQVMEAEGERRLARGVGAGSERTWMTLL